MKMEMRNEWKFVYVLMMKCRNKRYVVFADPEVESDEVFASAYDDDGHLLPVETEEEWQMIEEVIGAFQDDEEE